jgi:hypothetical protein
MIKSIRMRSSEHVAHGGEESRKQGFAGEIRWERCHLEDIGIDGGIDLKMDFKEIGW